MLMKIDPIYQIQTSFGILVGGPGINPHIRQKYGSRRGRRSNSGFPNVTSLKRMAKRFKSAATTKIQERAGLQPGQGSNMASMMASALMTGHPNVSSAEPSPSLDPSKKYHSIDLCESRFYRFDDYFKISLTFFFYFDANFE